MGERAGDGPLCGSRGNYAKSWARHCFNVILHVLLSEKRFDLFKIRPLITVLSGLCEITGRVGDLGVVSKVGAWAALPWKFGRRGEWAVKNHAIILSVVDFLLAVSYSDASF